MPYGQPRPATYDEVDRHDRFAQGYTEATYTGQYRDSNTELMYYGARFYDPYLGRFISPDSIVPDPGNPQALNRYSYVANNPVNFVDPSGNFTEEQLIEWFGEDWEQYYDAGWKLILLKGELGDAVFFGGSTDNPQLGVFTLQDNQLAMWDVGAREGRSVADVSSTSDSSVLSLYRPSTANQTGGPTKGIGDASLPHDALWDGSNILNRVASACDKGCTGPGSLTLPADWYRGNQSHVEGFTSIWLQTGFSGVGNLGLKGVMTFVAYQASKNLPQAALKGIGGPAGAALMVLTVADWVRSDTSYSIGPGLGFPPVVPVPVPNY